MENGSSEMGPETTAVIIQKVLDKHFKAMKTLATCYWEPLQWTAWPPSVSKHYCKDL